MEQFQDLIVGGVSLAGFIVLAVQALKQLPFVDEDNVAYLPWAVGGVFLVLYAVGALYPPAAPVIEAALQAIAGVLAAVLAYSYGIKPVVRNIAANLSINDLMEE